MPVERAEPHHDGRARAEITRRRPGGPPTAAPASASVSASRVLFICGSLNQTTQMHQIARQMPELEARFTPYYCDGFLELMRRAGLVEFTILGAA